MSSEEGILLRENKSLLDDFKDEEIISVNKNFVSD
jgi:hypothetical protein